MSGPAIESKSHTRRVGGGSIRQANVESIAKERAVPINARDGEAAWQAELDLCAEKALHLGLAPSAWQEKGIVGGLPYCFVKAVFARQVLDPGFERSKLALN